MKQSYKYRNHYARDAKGETEMSLFTTTMLQTHLEKVWTVTANLPTLLANCCLLMSDLNAMYLNANTAMF